LSARRTRHRVEQRLLAVGLEHDPARAVAQGDEARLRIDGRGHDHDRARREAVEQRLQTHQLRLRGRAEVVIHQDQIDVVAQRALQFRPLARALGDDPKLLARLHENAQRGAIERLIAAQQHFGHFHGRRSGDARELVRLGPWKMRPRTCCHFVFSGSVHFDPVRKPARAVRR
jgi:hypothetical protein